MRDGCGLADKALGGKSSCSECPFDDCMLSERQCAGYEGLHGIELEHSRIAEVNEVDSRERLRVVVRDTCGLDGFMHRWLPDAKQCDIRFDGDTNCLYCGVKLTIADNIYRRKYGLSSRRWCELCSVGEVFSMLRLRMMIGNWIIKLRSYERVWKGGLGG